MTDSAWALILSVIAITSIFWLGGILAGLVGIVAWFLGFAFHVYCIEERIGRITHER